MSEEKFHGQFAEEYDSLAEQYQTMGGEVIFGLQFDHVSPGQKLLDIGIGTGLSSYRYHRYGLEVYGVDISKEMLEICKQKKFAMELNVLNITADPIPYSDGFFDHVICHGVLHFFDDLSLIFKEVSRVLKQSGTFIFTVMTDENGGPKGDEVARKMTKWEREINLHGKGYISGICKDYAFNILSSLLYVGGIDPENGEKHYTWAYLVKKNSRIA